MVFIRPKIREQFLIAEERFKLKSWYATLIVLLLVMTLAILMFVLGYKVLNSVKKEADILSKKASIN
jgi:predicted negative regulator of RcsB-dependent stress response